MGAKTRSKIAWWLNEERFLFLQAARIKKQCGAQFVEESRSLTQLTLLFPAKAVRTVGFSAYITSLLSSQQINIHAEATCAGEHLIVVSESDLQRAIAVLGI